MKKTKLNHVLSFVLFLILTQSIFTAEVSEERALRVAENFLYFQKTNSGKWGTAKSPSIIETQPIFYKGKLIAYNCVVNPQGYMIVPARDEFTPIYIYSDTSTFLPENKNEPQSLESWIINEIYSIESQILTNNYILNQYSSSNEVKIAKAWAWLDKPTSRFSSEKTSLDIQIQSVKPLLTTKWGQGWPYYNLTPKAGSCSHTLTGCVATAWAQLMRYWRWPSFGKGSHSYLWWFGIFPPRWLSKDFSKSIYDWNKMPDSLDSTNEPSEIQAVALLMYDLGIAASMQFGCNVSNSTKYADSALDKYFSYKDDMEKLSRSNYNAADWFNLFKNELDAEIPRPIILSIETLQGAGHEVVVDGYETGITDKVHINFGWYGEPKDAYYDITNNFTANGDTWRGNDQILVKNIQPDSAYIIAGRMISPYGVVFVVYKLDPRGNKIWRKYFGGSGTDSCSSIAQPKTDGGYFLFGDTNSYTHGDPASDRDFLVYNIDKNGSKKWRKNYGGIYTESGYAVDSTMDGGCVIIGDTQSYTHGSPGVDQDILVYKLDSKGNKQWRKNYGTDGFDGGYKSAIKQTPDGGYILAGVRQENYGDYDLDIMVYRLDKSGSKKWRKFFHVGYTDQMVTSIDNTPDGGFVITGLHGYWDIDIWVLKLDAYGNQDWLKTYGGDGHDSSYSIRYTSDTGYILAGGSFSYSNGGSDFILYKIDSNGKKQWRKNYGGSGSDHAYSIEQTFDGGYIVAGQTGSYTHGGSDFLIYKLSDSGMKQWRKNLGSAYSEYGGFIIQTSK